MSELEAPAKKRRGYFVPGLIALTFLVVLGVLFGAGDLEHPASKTVEGPDISPQIAQGIQSVRATTSAPSVTCPPKEPVRVGLRFVCLADGAGLHHQTVYVVESDTRGEIRWSLTPP